MAEKHGGCLCGQVRFTVTEDNPAVAICHCTHCQKVTGSAFSLNALAPRGKFSCSGPLKKFDDVGDSGKALKR